jgi:hypothetical protein
VAPFINRVLRAHHSTAPRIFVETGTWKGQTTQLVAEMEEFDKVFTVELAKDLYQEVSAQLKDNDKIECIYGNAKEVVAILAEEIQEPVMWYLDAHHIDGTDTPREMSIFEEFAGIKLRKLPDIVIVDDVHMFGRREFEAPWSKLSPGIIEQALAPVHRAYVDDDHFVVHRKEVR